jgi:cytochrome c556
MKTFLILLAVSIGISGGPVVAQDADAAIKARQGQFRIMALNLATLGAIAKGETEYDAEVAQTAAANLVTISQIDQRLNWPKDSSQMDTANTRAEVEIWDNYDDFIAKWEEFGGAALAMQEAAGNGVDDIRAAMGTLGGTCKACHERYRAEN